MKKERLEIQKYKAKIKGTDTEVIGYITETREYLGQGTYGSGVDYIISVTEKSMPNGKYGTFKVDKETIKTIQIHSVSNSIANEYAEFCVRCDREKLPLLCLEDYINQYCH